MSTEESKFAVELAMFRTFVCACGLHVAAGSERKGSALPCEPDILLYRNGLTALTDDIMIARLRPELAGLGQFQTVWFHGDSAHRVAVA